MKRWSREKMIKFVCIPLAITVIGGVMVYYLTTKNDENIKDENASVLQNNPIRDEHINIDGDNNNYIAGDGNTINTAPPLPSVNDIKINTHKISSYLATIKESPENYATELKYEYYNEAVLIDMYVENPTPNDVVFSDFNAQLYNITLKDYPKIEHRLVRTEDGLNLSLFNNSWDTTLKNIKYELRDNQNLIQSYFPKEKLFGSIKEIKCNERIEIPFLKNKDLLKKPSINYDGITDYINIKPTLYLKSDNGNFECILDRLLIGPYGLDIGDIGAGPDAYAIGIKVPTKNSVFTISTKAEYVFKANSTSVLKVLLYPERTCSFDCKFTLEINGEIQTSDKIEDVSIRVSSYGISDKYKTVDEYAFLNETKQPGEELDAMFYFPFNKIIDLEEYKKSLQ